MSGEIRRAEPGLQSLFLMSGKSSLGAKFAWRDWKIFIKPTDRWKKQHPFAIYGQHSLKSARAARNITGVQQNIFAEGE